MDAGKAFLMFFDMKVLAYNGIPEHKSRLYRWAGSLDWIIPALLAVVQPG